MTVTFDGVSAPVPFVTLDALMRMKRRAGRPQDERDLHILASVRDEIERPRV